jgi:type VI secretion system protein ImpJ
VTRSLTVAVRFNETRVVGAIQGQRAVTVRAGGGRTNTMQFTLYAVPAG